MSNVFDYIVNGVRCTLVEPVPEYAALIREHFRDFDNVTLHEVAVTDHSGPVALVRREASTFLEELDGTPAIINDNYSVADRDKIMVEAKTFDMIDDGTIDVLSIDIEGGEWFLIKHMVSRPVFVSLETHGGI